MSGLRWGPLLLVGLCTLVAGCGGGEKTYDVSGTVRFDGKEVPRGTVFFDPDPTEGVGGPGGFATIRDGQYNTATEGRGPRGGPHIIRVQAYDGQGGPEAPAGRALCPEYQEKRSLPSANSVQDIDIPAKK